jgi:hypothetical protein
MLDASTEARWPTLSSWMPNAATDHPLCAVIRDADAGYSDVIDAFEKLVASVESASPTRWQSKRRDFRRLRTERQLLEMRAELVLAARLVNSGVDFAFGEHNVPSPDLVLEMGIGIEVTARAPEGVQDLYEALDDFLRGSRHASVTLRFSSYPVRIRDEDREALLADLRQIVVRTESGGEGGIAERVVVDGRNGSTVQVQAVVLPVPRLKDGLRVSWEVDAGPLEQPLGAVESTVLSVFDDDQKRRQAQSMPTILAVDIARLGAGWLRPPRVWAQRLAALMPPDTPFVGLAVFVPSLDRTDADVALSVSPSATPGERASINSLARALDLEAIDG